MTYQCHTSAALSRAFLLLFFFLEEPDHMPFLDQQSMRKRPLHTSRISEKICLRVKIWSVVLQTGQKPHWPSSTFDSTISRHFFKRTWHTPFLK